MGELGVPGLGHRTRADSPLQSRYDLDVALADHHEEFDQIRPLLSA